jgi:NTE family protein
MRFALLLAVLGAAALAQSNRPPKIALVLEGGAALGFAHVGVLEWLEENRIPIHQISGASMGGLLGGLYAAGYTPSQIRQVAQNADWAELLGGQTAFGSLAYRRKEDKQAYPNRLEVGVRNGFVLPAGFNEGHSIGLLLSRLFIAYPKLKSFRELPTPFACVAADLISGQSVVLDSGSLPEALRSTMSIPAMFSPVRRGKQVLVDGGLLNNLPVDVAKRSGADIVIAVHLSKGPVDPGKVGSLVEVLGRSISVVIGASEMRSMQLADVVLVADLAKYQTTDYTKSNEIADVGRTAAAQKANLLRRFALSEEEYRAYQKERQGKVRRLPPEPAFVAVRGAGARVDASLQERLSKLVEARVSPEVFEQELNNTVGLGRLASISYNQEINEQGKSGLEIVASPRVDGPVFVNPAIEIQSNDGVSRFSLASRLSWLDVWGFRSEWRSDIAVGSRYLAATEFYKPLSPNSRWFVAPRVYIDSQPFEIYANQRRVGEYRLRQHGVQLDAGLAVNRFAELRLGYHFNWIRATQRVGLPLVESLRLRRDALSFRFNYEGQDENVVARRGLRLNARAEYFPQIGAAEIGRVGARYSLGEIRAVHFQPVWQQNSLLLGVSGGGIAGPLENELLGFSLGGPQRLGAYGNNEIRAKNYVLGTVGVLHEVKSDPSLFGSKLYLTAFAQAGRTDGVRADGVLGGIRNPASVSGAVILKTLLGPVFVGGSLGDGGQRRWYFGMGRFF